MEEKTRGLCDLFRRPDVDEFIETVATAKLLSLIAGAGTSIESGFPDWNRLLTRLLAKLAETNGLSGDAIGEFARWTIEREGLVGAAAVAESSFGDNLPIRMHEALYDQQLTPPPGQTALSIARIFKSFGSGACDVSTTNYDLVLESGVAAVTGKKPTTATGANTIGTSRVLHLHGVMKPRGGTQGNLILSERDYFLMQEDSAWQQIHFAERLSTSLCLFVGASLTDPNLLRYLYRLSSDRSHYAIFIRQQDAGIYDDADSDVIELREKSNEHRWNQAGIKPLHADFFSQSAQLLQEVLHRRVSAANRRVYRPLPRRLTIWRNKMESSLLGTQESGFSSRQDDLHTVMKFLLSGVRADLADSNHRLAKGEKLGLSMWVYDPRSESLTNWASADRIWRDPKTLEPLPVDWTSDFVSVQAFCTGSMVSRSTEKYAATRWNHVVGSPIYVESERVGRLPVGAVTIASTLPSPHSVLYRGRNVLRRTSLPTVEKALADLLSPVETVPSNL